jgi:hypothetical protein
MRMRFKPTTFSPTCSHMRRIWRFLPSVSTKRSCSGFCQSTRAGFSGWPSRLRPWRRRASMRGWEHRLHIGRDRIVVVDAPPQWRRLVWAVVGHAHQVLLLHARVLADQLAGDAAVLRQHQQAGGVDVQATGRREAAQLLRRETVARRIAGPVGALLHQHHRGLVAILGLAADVAHRLVQQDGHLLLLLAGGRLSTSMRAVGADLQSHRRDGAVHAHPAAARSSRRPRGASTGPARPCAC